MHGRGYVYDGDAKAAAFLTAEFKRLNVAPISGNYYQSFNFPVNTFPAKMCVRIGNKKLIPGVDYIVYPASSGARSCYTLEHVDSATLLYSLGLFGNTCLVIEMKDFNAQREAATALLAKKQTGAVLFVEEKKLTWSVSQNHYAIPIVTALKKNISREDKRIKMKFTEVFKDNHQTQNVIGRIDGSTNPDSFIVITAHYDHLGRMGGKAIFNGANDNASGSAMLLNLAQHYAKLENRPKFSMVFILFAGEEAGLVGSKYFTENPLIDLAKIKFLINLDLLGTGDEGMMVVNAKEHKKEFDLLKSINDQQKYLPVIGERGKAKNSDHYYFSEKGVPAFFFYTMGGIQAYHDIYDRAETLPLTKFKEAFRLIRDFSDAL